MKKAIFIILIVFPVFAQSSFEAILNDVNRSFAEREFSSLEKHTYFRTFLSMGEAYVGYYSSAQTVKLIKEYFASLDAYSFKIKFDSHDNDLGYISGKCFYTEGGKHASREIFLTLKKINDNWQITQITVN